MSKLCPSNDQDDGSLINSFYVCHQNEICCSDGCCSVINTNKYFQSWYFWLIVTLIFIFFYSCSWYCKNFENIRKRRIQQIYSRNQSIQVSTRRNDVAAVNHEEADYFANTNIIRASKVKDNSSEPPPKYQEAVNLPKQMNNTQVAQIHQSDDENSFVINFGTSSKVDVVPPSYQDAM